jgi:anti-anti-sigma factor
VIESVAEPVCRIDLEVLIHDSDIAELVVRGTLDAATAPMVSWLVDDQLELVGRPRPRISVDLRAVDFIDCAAVGCLVECAHACTRAGATMTVRPSPVVSRLLELAPAALTLDLSG